MQAETSATPLLTEDKTSSLLRQDCPFHSVSTLELVDKAKGLLPCAVPRENVLCASDGKRWSIKESNSGLPHTGQSLLIHTTSLLHENLQHTEGKKVIFLFI